MAIIIPHYLANVKRILKIIFSNVWLQMKSEMADFPLIIAILRMFGSGRCGKTHLPERNPQKSTLLREKQREKNFIGMATT